jgi:hypothetical protein
MKRPWLAVPGSPFAPGISPAAWPARGDDLRLLVEALTRNTGNLTRAAHDIKVSRPTFHDLLRKHGIEAGPFRNSDVPGQPESAEAGEADGDEPGGPGEERP